MMSASRMHAAPHVHGPTRDQRGGHGAPGERSGAIGGLGARGVLGALAPLGARLMAFAGALLLAACAAAPPAADAVDPAAAPSAEVGASAGPEADFPLLLVGSDLDNRPFAWVDDAGRPQGRDVEMMAAIANLLHRKLQWQRMPFDQLMPAVQAGRVDVVCATLGITPEREALMGFSRPYFATEIVAVVRAGQDEPTSLDMLAGRRVAGGIGTTAERAITNHLKHSIGVFENKAGMPSAERLLSREVDAVVMDAPAAAALVAASGGKLVVLPEALESEDYALAFPLDSHALRSECDRALASFERAGSLARWNEKFGLATAPAH